MTDITAEVTGWVAGEIAKQRFGEDFGYAVSLGLAAVQTPQGVAQVPMWTLLITARNPLLKEGPLYHGPVPIGTPRPEEKNVRAEVTNGLKALRDLAASKLSAGNGRAPAGARR
jgi:hypothetical protein